MAKPLEPHHINCNCCGKQASFKEFERQPSGFGALKSSPSQNRPNTHHQSTRPLERKKVERIGSAIQRRRSLQHGSKFAKETLAQCTLDVVIGKNHKAVDITAKIAEAVVKRGMLQAIESRMVGTSRDKESLLEECLALKDALCNQHYHLQLHKVHHKSIDLEERKLEIKIQELEMENGLIAPRTGHPLQLKAKITGLINKQQEYFVILSTLAGDLEILKKDPRCSFTKEATIERDVFAIETRRLQKMIRQLRIIYHKVCTENNEIVRLRENISTSMAKVKLSQMNINTTKSIIAQMKRDLNKAKADIIEAQGHIRDATSKAGKLESHSMVLQNMLIREKEESIDIQKQTSAVNEQIRIVRKDNADKAAEAAFTAGMVASIANKSLQKSVKKGGKKTKLKESNKDVNKDELDTTTTTIKAITSESSLSIPKVLLNKDFDEIQANYLKSIGEATNTFVESALGSKSPQSKSHPNLGSPIGNHLGYEELQDNFQHDVTNAENKFLDIMEKLEYGTTKPRKDFKDLEVEANRLRAELEASKKSQLDVKQWLENLTIELDDKSLKSNEYIIDVKDTKTNVRITSPDKSPEALARKKADEEARRKAEEEARNKKEAEEEAKKKAKEEARNKKEAEEAARRAAEDEARNKKEADEAARRAAEDEARNKKEAEEATRRAAEDEARRKRDAEEATKRATEDEARRKRDAEEATKRAAEDEARRKRDVEDEARRKRDAKEAARQAAEDEAKRKRDAEDEARRKEDAEATRRVAEGSSEGKRSEFFNKEMQGIIKENIKEVLGHLEVISETVQQKATSSSTAETSAKEVLEKIDKPDNAK